MQTSPRRPGDVAELVADSSLARSALPGWQARKSLREILLSAWSWELKKRGQLRKAVFLDRDGTINIDPGYIKNPDDLKLIDGAARALRKLQDAGFALVVVTNQSGVGRGYFSENDLRAVHARLDELLAAEGVKINYYSVCIHRPEAQCDCRKPLPKLLTEGGFALGLDPELSFMVGDKILDLGAGRNAGCRSSVLVRTGWGEDSLTKLVPGQADFVAKALPEAVEWILSQEETPRS